MSGRPELSADLRKGWCPGALRPMMARDGLLVRLKITGGIVPAELALAVADLAERHGNGLLDLSARANLQLRGVREDSLPALLDGLDTLDLLDADPAAEAIRNVLASPLAGLHRQAACDIRPLAAALEKALVADPELLALPTKFGVLVDDGGAPSLAGIAADIRFDWHAAEQTFAVGLGGTAAGALTLGNVTADAVVACAIGLAHRLIGVAGGPRRIRTLMADIGRDATAALFGARVQASTPSNATPQVVGHQTFAGLATLGLAAPFGRLDPAMLRAAAHVALETGGGELRLTPWRTILVPHVAPGQTDLAALAGKGFIVDAGDPRLRIAACTGQAGCERGTTDTHADATALADLTAKLSAGGISLHVSGCAKGCARPARTAVTLVARDGRYDLVRDGRSGDAPALSALDLADVRETLFAA